MILSTSRNTPKAQEQPTFTAQHYVAGDGAKQVPFAGMLVDDPSLEDAVLTATEWEQRLSAYQASPRPCHRQES